MKRLLIASAILLAILFSLFLHQIYKPENPLMAELASPSQEKRDVAAKILRTTAKPTSKLKWLFFTLHIRKGESEINILNLLRSYNLSTRIESGMGGLRDNWEYRLDNYWLLSVELNNNDYKNKFLEQWKLVPRWQAIAVWPSTNFTGIWVNYYANGQKFTEGRYTNGSRYGEFITYEPDGSKSSVWHYDNWKANGLFTQYFPSGQIRYQVQYSNNTKVGNGIWYNKNGSTNHISYYSKQ